MLPPIHRTFYINPREECTSPFNCGSDFEIAFIRNHQDNTEYENTYVQFPPVFKIMQTILQEMNTPYIIHFERIGYNYDKWKEDNAVLRILFVH
jgi:hypothetical protein